MTPLHRITPAAEADLDVQVAYLADQTSLESALWFYDAAESSFEAIARMPGIGARWQSAKTRLTDIRTS